METMSIAVLSAELREIASLLDEKGGRLDKKNQKKIEKDIEALRKHIQEKIVEAEQNLSPKGFLMTPVGELPFLSTRMKNKFRSWGICSIQDIIKYGWQLAGKGQPEDEKYGEKYLVCLIHLSTKGADEEFKKLLQKNGFIIIDPAETNRTLIAHSEMSLEELKAAIEESTFSFYAEKTSTNTEKPDIA